MECAYLGGAYQICWFFTHYYFLHIGLNFIICFLVSKPKTP